jgi:glutathionyl-hydroquinone reductase
MDSHVKAQFPDEQSPEGQFVRQEDQFRGWVSADGHTGFPAVARRYELFVSLACPWAHRTVIMRKLKRLDAAIPMTIVDPIRDDRGWRYGTHFLSELYLMSDPNYRGRVTVPVLWDPQTKRIVSNSDDDILRMFETEFDAVGDPKPDFYPPELRAEIDALNEEIFHDLNDGVYQAGFATSQAVYEEAAYRVFAMLDRLEERLATRRFLLGKQPVETDWRAFVTLIRFDPVYYGHFKCNLRRIVDYPNLYGYLRDLYQIPGVASTVDFDHIKRHYYYTHDDINPTRIVPIGPLQYLEIPANREHLSA